MKKASSKQEIRITIRFPKELIDKINSLAKKDVRSTHGEIIYLLQKAVEAEEIK
jgi:hypothetical protein